MNITIVYHAYENYKNLEESLESIFIQEDQNFEFILIDDFANEKTRHILQKFNFNDLKQFKYVNFSQNMGHSFSYNHGTKLTTSKYIFYSGSSTILNKNFIKDINEIITNEKNVDVFSINNCKKLIIDEEKIEYHVLTQLDDEMFMNIKAQMKDKVFSVEFLKANNIVYNNFRYYPLVLYVSILINFKKWVSIDNNLIFFKASSTISYNIYDILYQNVNVIDSYYNLPKYSQYKQRIEFLIITALLLDFITKTFKHSPTNNIKSLAIKNAFNLLDDKIPKWRENFYLSKIKEKNIKNYLLNFKPSYFYVKKYLLPK